MYPNSQEEFNIINTEEAEENFPDDDDNTEVEEMIYRENCWPSKEPTGFTYKSKKSIFIKAVENLKLQISKKLNQISFGNITCKI